MNNLLLDIRYALRSLLKRPGLTVILVLTLALSIGANTAIFSVTDKLLLRSLAVKDPEQLFLVTSVSVSPHFVSNVFSYPIFDDYRKQNTVLSGVLAFQRTELELKAGDSSERIQSEYVSGNYFDLLGVKAKQGRTFLPEEDRTPGTQPVVVISDSLRRRKFLNEDPIGKLLVLNNIALTIVGVAPADFRGMVLEEPTEVWVPVLMAQSQSIGKRTDRFLQLLLRVNPSLSIEQSERQTDALAQQIRQANTPAGTITKGLPFSEQHIKFEPGGKGISLLRKRFASPLKLLLVVVILVLVIACANIGGLLLARGLSRRKEIAIRLSLGANSWQVARQLLCESLLLALAGGGASLLIAPWLVTLLVRNQTRLEIARSLLGTTIDTRVLLFTAGITLLAGLFFGILPAWQSTKSNVLPMLKDDLGIGNHPERRFTFRSVLVVSQLALAVVVLIGASLCVKSFRNLLAIDPGYQSANLLVVPLELDEKKYDEVQGASLQRQIVDRLTSLPGVESVSYGQVMPFSGSRSVSSLFVEGRQPMPNEDMAFDQSVVGPHYHESMGIKIVEGRGFTELDRDGAPKVVIINEALARKLFPGEKALGKRVTLKTNSPGMEIVGITLDVKHHDLTEAPVPHFDLPALQRGYNSYTNFVLRTNSSATGMISSVRSELLSLDPTLDLRDISSESSQIDGTLAATRLASTLIGVFGIVALVLASLGLYGVMSWMVGRRTREVGIRIALGAQRQNVILLVLRQGMTLTLLGVVLGLGAALLATRWIDTQQLYEVTATDPYSFISIAILLTVVSLLACYVPARRATKVDPLVALRYE